MSYALASDLIARFGEPELIQQTDLTSAGAYNAATVARALDDASALIDGYLAGRYAVPLASVPALLVTLACDLARYALYVDAVPDVVRDRRDQAVATLRDIAAGRVLLDVSVSAGGAGAGAAIVGRAGRKVFGGGLG